jgi:hypothetical protein
MLRLMLALLAVLAVAASLTSRLSEVRAAGNKTKTQSGKYEDMTVNVGTGMSKGYTRSTTSGKHIPKGQVQIRR